jgi:hypothetical protein
MRQQQFTQYYLTQAGFVAHAIGGIGTVYYAPPFVQKGQEIGNIFGVSSERLGPTCGRPPKSWMWKLKTLGREALRANTNIVHDSLKNKQKWEKRVRIYTEYTSQIKGRRASAN